MSYSADGVFWTPYRGGAPVIDNENDRYGVNAFRDPKVVRCDEDTWLMIVGGGVLRLFASARSQALGISVGDRKYGRGGCGDHGKTVDPAKISSR